jgi:hypothetical protein
MRSRPAADEPADGRGWMTVARAGRDLLVRTYFLLYTANSKVTRLVLQNVCVLN